INGEEKLTASIPDSIAPADISNEVAQKLIDDKQRGPLALGIHPEEGQAIYLLNGPFGPYLQLGEVTEEVPKPKRCGLPACFPPDEMTLETAVQLLALPVSYTHLRAHETGDY
ncbi:MAG: topoisomerase C-terminal repeat-containing protein, partial [Phycisphaerae bacterium]